MDVEDAIRGRRSVREYTKEPVSDGDIDVILDAGRWAPSGLNNQPWRFMVLRGERKDSISRFTKYGGIIRKAPVCVAVFFDRESGYDRTKDMQAIGACIQNMLLAIHDLGLGAVWLGEIVNQHEKVEAALGLKHELMAIVAIGHPIVSASEGERKGLDELMIEDG